MAPRIPPVPRPLLLLVGGLLALPAAGQPLPPCGGVVLEVRGAAERPRRPHRLRASLRLSAEAATAAAALALLQDRLGAARRALQGLAVQDLRVSAPTTWTSPADRGRPPLVTASLQIGGLLAPDRFPALIRDVGGLAGVTLGGVTTESDSTEDAAVRRSLLQTAYRDALTQAQDLAPALGRGRLLPLEVVVEGGGATPLPVRALEAAPVSRFDPEELPVPIQRAELRARFCAL
jgi:uncharacterized protein YggE